MTLSVPQIVFIVAFVTAVYISLGFELRSARQKIEQLQNLVAEYEAARLPGRNKLGRFVKR